MIAARGTALALTGVSLGLCACGAGDREFSASELVDELNRHGAGLELRAPLVDELEGSETYAVEFASPTQEAQGSGRAHAGGSLTITEDAEAAVAEFERCEGAVSLVCYRVANAVLLFEDEISPAHRARMDASARALAAD